MTLTPEQHLDAIEAVVLDHGGRFKWLSNTIPAYRAPEQKEWVKLGVSPSSWDFAAFLNDTGLDPFKVPTSKAPLGGLARWQDTVRLKRDLKAAFSHVQPSTMSAKQMALIVTEQLSSKGLVFAGRGNFADVVERAFQRKVDPDAVINALDIGGHEHYYPEHHSRLRAAPLDARLHEDGYLRVLSDPDKLIGMAVNQAHGNPYNVNHFIKFLHANSCKANLYMTLHDQPGSPEKLNSEVATYLRACFEKFAADDDANALSEALGAIKFAYAPLRQAPSAPSSAHVAKLRALLREPSGERAEPPAVNKNSVSPTSVDLMARVAVKVASENLLRYADTLVLPESIREDWQSHRRALDAFAVVGGDLDEASAQLNAARDTLIPVAHNAQRKALSATKQALTLALANSGDSVRELVEDAWAGAMQTLKSLPIERSAELVGVCETTFSAGSLNKLCQGLATPEEKVTVDKLEQAKQKLDDALGFSIK